MAIIRPIFSESQKFYTWFKEVAKNVEGCLKDDAFIFYDTHRVKFSQSNLQKGSVLL
jgi:hypothetical protein